MAEPVGFPLRTLDLATMRRGRGLTRASLVPECRDLVRRRLQAGERVEQPAVGRSVDQRALVMLSMDLDQRRPQLLEDLRAHRLVVDEGARAAVDKLDPAQDQLVLGRDVVLAQQRARRMSRRQLEGRRHLPLLGTVTHQGGISARPERQREGVEQDRFAGAGFAGERREPRCEVDVEPIDQHDVSDRKPGQHARFQSRSDCRDLCLGNRDSPSSKTRTVGTSPAARAWAGLWAVLS